MAMAAGGGRGQILGDGNGFGLAFKADALWVGTHTKAVDGPGGRLAATDAAVNRLRTARRWCADSAQWASSGRHVDHRDRRRVMISM